MQNCSAMPAKFICEYTYEKRLPFWIDISLSRIIAVSFTFYLTQQLLPGIHTDLSQTLILPGSRWILDRTKEEDFFPHLMRYLSAYELQQKCLYPCHINLCDFSFFISSLNPALKSFRPHLCNQNKDRSLRFPPLPTFLSSVCLTFFHTKLLPYRLSYPCADWLLNQGPLFLIFSNI